METNNVIVDVVYDDTQIYHVLEPNEEGVRGIPKSQFMIRDTIGSIKIHLQNLDLSKIEEYENELQKLI